MESVYFEACRLLDVPAHDWQLVTRDGTAVRLYTPVLEAHCRLRQPLLLTAATPTVKADRRAPDAKDEDGRVGARTRLVSPPSPPTRS
eukprot:13422630-Alexandrium_andersonii.AAC.1